MASPVLFSLLWVSIAIVAAPLVLIAFSVTYDKLGTYHYLDSSASNRSDIKDSESESFTRKVWWVIVYNFIAVLLTTTFVYLYQFDTDTFPITTQSIFAIAILTTLLHSTIRVVSFIDFEYFGDDTVRITQNKNRLISLALSFSASIFFLLVLSIGLGISTGDIGPTVEYDSGSVDAFASSLYFIFTIIAIVGLSMVGEFILKYGTVHECLKNKR
jgi:hypothetical protein